MVTSIARYVAIGDSFTEGLWDPGPGLADVQRGWADRLAETISSRRIDAGLSPLEYANHAVRGKLLPAIIDDQLQPALDHCPDLISIVGGGNDVLRPGSDPDMMAALLERAVVAARKSGAKVLLGTGMDPADLPIVGAIRNKVALYNAHIWSIAQRQGAAVVDLWGLTALRHWHMWSEDRIHLSPLGHDKVAQGALFALGLEPDDPLWRDPLPLVTPPRMRALREDGAWLRRDVFPWATRRLRRRSSGDERVPKFPTLTKVTPPRDGATRRE